MTMVNPYWLEDAIEFVLSLAPRDRGWFERFEPAGSIQLYARRGPRYIEGRYRPTLDVASISIHPLGTGAFTALLDRLEAIPHNDALYVECILNPRLPAFLQSRGYTQSNADSPPSFHKILRPHP